MQTVASRRMEQFASILADSRFAAGMDDEEQPARHASALAAGPSQTVALDSERDAAPFASKRKRRRSVVRLVGVVPRMGLCRSASGAATRSCVFTPLT